MQLNRLHNFIVENFAAESTAWFPYILSWNIFFISKREVSGRKSWPKGPARTLSWVENKAAAKNIGYLNQQKSSNGRKIATIAQISTIFGKNNRLVAIFFKKSFGRTKRNKQNIFEESSGSFRKFFSNVSQICLKKNL